jgi:2-(3-amino-3-carboxypropyl)histidine synthase
MKTIFIPARFNGKIELDKIELDRLPGKLGLVTTAQFLDTIKEIKTYLEKNNKEVFIDKEKQTNEGQLLGCDTGAAEKIQNKVDAFLYIGSGRFHPLGVSLKTNKEVFTFNPITSTFNKLNQNEIEKYKNQKKVRLTKFLSADNIGILVSLKPGQYSYKKAEEIKNKLEKDGKNAFIFVFDTLDSNELNNFTFVDFWVNTACPRIADDEDKKNIISMGDIL